ncbi:hypothetical protein DL546_003079 [Coniochaeta pulveracea]|uniref:Vacuolar calcium ion transporter n=1 Tax=Coniochaeta pulveracea TaxID=177199 RepID=A0A420YFQ2_9PEZI|nr:hypothetical protein DL546_003079 [Coniochaeta pulveracea]
MAPRRSNDQVVEKRRTSQSSRDQRLPMHNEPASELSPSTNGHVSPTRVTPGIKAAGESGRSGFHPLHFFRIIFRSSSKASRICNFLWPVVPAAIAVRYARPDNHLVIFILAYLAMIPCANLIGFAGQELARKVPHVWGVLIEVTVGSVVEIVLFMVLISRPENAEIDYIPVIQAAILGSILATMLLCLGLCFIAGGLKRDEQTFSESVSEAGSGLLLTAGFGLAIPTAFEYSLRGGVLSEDDLRTKAVGISRVTAILLMIAYFVFLFYQARSHHSIYDAIFEADEEKDRDRAKDLEKDKLTLTECILGIAASVALVTITAIALVDQIHFIVRDRGVSDAFMGLILVPLVEKAAEHLTAIDEAYDNQMNFALSHVLGATLQTALFNAPLVVIVGWGLGRDMGLNFEMFNLVVLILAIITVGNFLRDQKSNYLEGTLCVIVYVAVAVAAAYYPNPTEHTGSPGEPGSPAEGH